MAGVAVRYGRDPSGWLERSGTKQPAVSGIESAKKLPTLGLLLRIAAALDRRLVIRFEKIKDSE